MIFKQFFEPQSSTYTYLIACPETGTAALIDPVIDVFDRDLETIRELGLNLNYAIETHIHADHITGGLKLKSLTDCKLVGAEADQLPCRDIGVSEGTALKIGHIELHPLFTPGHTDTHYAYLIDNGTHKMIFTGDALLIEGCGRTDFQSGDSGVLYDSVYDKIFSLSEDTLVYPAHDYENRRLSSVGQEKMRNPRLKVGTTREQFVTLMGSLEFPKPQKMDYAVPGNQMCGRCPDNLPASVQPICDMHDQG